MTYEVWFSEELQLGVLLAKDTVRADDSHNLILIQAYRPSDDWVVDHTFEAASVNDANRTMVKWVETKVPTWPFLVGHLLDSDAKILNDLPIATIKWNPVSTVTNFPLVGLKS